MRLSSRKIFPKETESYSYLHSFKNINEKVILQLFTNTILIMDIKNILIKIDQFFVMQ